MPEKALSERDHRLLDHSSISGLKEASLNPPRRGLLTPEILARLETLEAAVGVLGRAEAGDYPTVTEMRQAIQAAVVAATGGASGTGVTDHGELTGLADDDHTAYLNETRHDALDHTGLTGCGGGDAVSEVFLSAKDGWPANTNGCSALAYTEIAANGLYIPHLSFGATNTEYAQWQFLLPEWYSGGTVTAKFLWSCVNGGGTAAVVWQAQLFALANDEGLDVSWGTAQSVIDPTGTNANVMLFTDATPAITIANTPAAGHACFLRVARLPGDSSDTYGQPARLHGVYLDF